MEKKLVNVSVLQAQYFLLAVTRILSMLIQIPVLGGRIVPNQVKVGLGLLLAILIPAWSPLPQDAPAMPPITLTFALGTEVLIGTLAGFGARLVFTVVQVAGSVMGIGSGFGAGQILNPAFEDSGSVMNNFFVMMSTLLFFVLDGHHSFIRALSVSFDLLPINSPFPIDSPDRLISMASSLITLGIQMAMPVLGAVLLADLTMGLLARVAPQVNVFFLGAPLKVGVGLLTLALGLVVLFPILSDLFDSIGTRMLKLLGA
jgi:flagellar biosynthetic protein FliR